MKQNVLEQIGMNVVGIVWMVIGFSTLFVSSAWVAHSFLPAIPIQELATWGLAATAFHILLARINSRDIESPRDEPFHITFTRFIIKLLAIGFTYPLGHLILWMLA